jgi:hypothetical protein
LIEVSAVEAGFPKGLRATFADPIDPPRLLPSVGRMTPHDLTQRRMSLQWTNASPALSFGNISFQCRAPEEIATES